MAVVNYDWGKSVLALAGTRVVLVLGQINLSRLLYDNLTADNKPKFSIEYGLLSIKVL